MSSTIRPLYITIIGDGCVGKTCLMEVFAKNKYPEYTIPTDSDMQTSVIIYFDDKKYTLTLCETPCQEDRDNLNPLSFPNTNCILLCYSISDRDTFTNIESKWWPKIRQYDNEIPIVLVGTKLDLRIEITPKFVTTGEGDSLKAKIHAYSFVECSAWKNVNLQHVFEEAVRAIEKKRNVN
ncbi:ras-like GTP-binding protein RhoL isoform 1-T2 [Cochliomyia hominivorax]